MKVFYAVTILAGVSLLISGVFLFIPGWLPQHLQNDMDSRVGLAQLPIAVASLAAFFFGGMRI